MLLSSIAPLTRPRYPSTIGRHGVRSAESSRGPPMIVIGAALDFASESQRDAAVAASAPVDGGAVHLAPDLAHRLTGPPGQPSRPVDRQDMRFTYQPTSNGDASAPTSVAPEPATNQTTWSPLPSPMIVKNTARPIAIVMPVNHRVNADPR